MSGIKLPKQWKHWIQCAGLHTESKRWSGHQFYFQGKNRNWRVNCYGVFECSCPLEHFDRWANSRGAETDLPTSKKDFLFCVKRLIEDSRDAK